MCMCYCFSAAVQNSSPRGSWQLFSSAVHPLAVMASVDRKTFLGQLPTELVLRGGMLDKPIVVTDIVMIQGRQFMRLRKGDAKLSQFLTGVALSQRQMSNSTVIERLTTLRDDKYTILLQELGHAGGTDTVEESADDLGLNGSTGGSPTTRPNKSKVRSLMPAITTLAVVLPDGSEWQPSVMMDPRHIAPAMEATSENLDALFVLVRQDMDDGNVRRPQFGCEREPGVAKAPRLLSDGSREYWSGHRWVRKLPVPKGVIAGQTRKFTCLVRRSSDEAASSSAESHVRGRGRGRGRGCGRKAPKVAVAVAGDSLGLD